MSNLILWKFQITIINFNHDPTKTYRTELNRTKPEIEFVSVKPERIVSNSGSVRDRFGIKFGSFSNDRDENLKFTQYVQHKMQQN